MDLCGVLNFFVIKNKQTTTAYEICLKSVILRDCTTQRRIQTLKMERFAKLGSSF